MVVELITEKLEMLHAFDMAAAAVGEGGEGNN